MKPFLKHLNFFRFSLFIFFFSISVTATALFFQDGYSSAAGQTATVVNSQSGPHADPIKKSQEILSRLSGFTKEIDQIYKDVKAAVLPGQVEVLESNGDSASVVYFSKPDSDVIARIDSVEKTLTVRNKSNRPVSSKSLTGLKGAFVYKGGEYPGIGGTCKEVIAKGECALVVLFDPKKGEGIPLSYDTTVLRHRLSPVKLGYSVAGKALESNALTLDGKAYLPSTSKIKFEQRREPGAVLVGDTGDFFIGVTSGDFRRSPFKKVTLSPLVAPFFVKENTCVGDLLTNCKILISFTPTKAGAFPLNLNISADDDKTTQEAKITLKGQAILGGSDNDASKHLLVVYNESWQESVETKNYYIANRPEFTSANTLGIQFPISTKCFDVACLANVLESAPHSKILNTVVSPVLLWLREHPDKDIRYIVLMRGLPTRFLNEEKVQYGSASIQTMIRNATEKAFGKEVFITSVDMGSLEATKGYIDKLKVVYGLMSQKSPVISARGTDKAGTVYHISDAVKGGRQNEGEETVNALMSANPNARISYTRYGETSPRDLADVAGFQSHGIYEYKNGTGVDGWNGDYAINGWVKFTGKSGWYIIETVESFNGLWMAAGHQGNFIRWFSKNAFGGNSFSNTPVAAVTRINESASKGGNVPDLFPCWDAGKPFVYCAWKSSRAETLQAVGDPWVTR